MNSTAPPIVGYVDYARYHSGIGWALTMLDYVMLCASVRYDNAVPGDARRYARMHPLSSFVGSMTLCFGGVAFCSQCLRDGGLLDELNDRVMVTAIFVWLVLGYNRVTRDVCSNTKVIYQYIYIYIYIYRLVDKMKLIF